MKISASLTEAGPYLLSKSEMQDIGRDAIEAAGKLWHYIFKRRHFQLEAFELYHYRKRSAAWVAEKAILYPDSGGRPLVASGDSERQAMAQNRVKATAKDYRTYHADVTVSAPTLNYHSNEMTRTTDEEDAAMEAKFGEVYADGVAAAWKSHGVSSHKIELGRAALSAA